MIRALAGISIFTALTSIAPAQSAGTPAAAFDVADVHASPHSTNPYMSGGILRGGRYDLRNATMLDMIQAAYNVDESAKIIGGPGWLNTDRFDVAAKAPAGTPPEALSSMLQNLLAERFSLKIHRDTRPLPVFILSLGKGKPKMKEAAGSGPSGCQGVPQNPAPGETRYNVITCHNMTMATLAQTLRGLASGYVTEPAVDQTGLEGTWDFELKWSSRGQAAAAGSNFISLFDALDKQLGLKMEAGKVPLAVMVVDSANSKPTDNDAAAISKLPPAPPAEFEVATIRPSAPDAQVSGRVQNGRVDLVGWPLKMLVRQAWNFNSDDMIVGAPKFMDSVHYDIVAKAPSAQVDDDDLLAMLKGLVVERFKMVTHTETRPVPAYTLSAAKPKLQKADPSHRSECKDGPGPDGKDPRLTNPILGRLVTCYNTTMQQLAEQFQNFASGYIHDTAIDETHIEGAYDFTLSFSGAGALRNGGGLPGDVTPGAAATEPNGALSLFEAVNKQLGLKLELQKRPMQVLVIDHIEEKPVDN